jgi:hypothetical protein
MTHARRILLASFLLPALFTPGCRCIRTPASIRASDEMQRQMKKDLETRETAAASPSPGDPAASAFDIEGRLEGLRDSYASQRWDAVRHDGLALATAALDEVTKLEVYAMLVDAFRESRDRERSREFAEQFKALYDELRASPRIQKEARDRDRLLQVMGRFKRKAPTDLFADAEGEPRLNFKLADKLRSGGTGEVMEESMPEGGTVYFSRSPEALESRLSGVSRDLAAAIQRDAEFEYYYAVAEPPPPAEKRR